MYTIGKIEVIPRGLAYRSAVHGCRMASKYDCGTTVLVSHSPDIDTGPNFNSIYINAYSFHSCVELQSKRKDQQLDYS